MNSLEVMEILLGRVTYSEDGVAWFTAHEMQQWPLEAVEALKGQQLLKRSRDAGTALCDGCEEACVLPVQSVRNGATNEAVLFLLCTLRSDTNRVMVDSSRLRQWRASIERLCDFVATDLSINRSNVSQDEDSLFPVGLFHGEQRGQLLLLQLDTPLMLVAGDQSLPLSELIGFEEGHYRINRALVTQLVDHATGDERHTPSTVRREARKLRTQERNERWRKAYRKIKRENPTQTDNWIANQIAKLDIAQGRDSETIRKQMKK